MIQARFESLRQKGEKALVAFVTAGDPSTDALSPILFMLQTAGVDVIEIGIPFSDPIADGPVIQASSQRALSRGVNPHGIFNLLAKCKVSVPIVLMGYYNSALKFGLEAFATAAKEAGVSGVILSDLPPEESAEWRAACAKAGLDSIFLVAPTSTDERLKSACEASRGFVYAVSRTGVTGAQSSLSADAVALVNRTRQFTDLPICVGFGISSPEQVESVCQVADGAVVGSWLVDTLRRDWSEGRGVESIRSEVAMLKAATRA